ncbi:hypothetical protein BJ742DRAFT_828333 [Cladochytrium replicatum]|nr:hypothetical protein BJ742DRAFT_828333 [Cladochytrium replicatum]
MSKGNNIASRSSRSHNPPRKWRLARLILLIAIILLVLVEVAIAGQDYYAILGVSRSSSKREIKKAYKELSKKYHPDKNKGQQDKFIELAHAYEVLSDDEKRRIYDQYGEDGLKNQGQKFHDPFDIFAQFGFGGGGFGGGFQQAERRGPEIRLDLRVSLEEIFSGKTLEIDMNKQVICPLCRGSGAKSENDVHKCSSCNGSGVRIVRQQLGPGIFQQMQTTCDVCGGRGKVVKSTCPSCKGHKVKRGSHPITISIERGMADGSELRFEREGDQSPDHSPGDVVFTVVTEPHSTFQRNGDNLYMSRAIGLKEALLGVKWKLEHLDANVVEIVREGVTQPGFVQTVAGQGMPKHDDPSERGNLFVEYIVALPQKLTKDQSKGFEKLL